MTMGEQMDPQEVPLKEDLKYAATGTVTKRTIFLQNPDLTPSNNQQENILRAVTYNGNEKPLQILAHPIKQNNEIIQNGFAFSYNDDGSIKISYLKGAGDFKTGYVFDFDPSSGMVFGVTQYTLGRQTVLLQGDQVFGSSSNGIAIKKQTDQPFANRLKTEVPSDGVEMDYLPQSGRLLSLRVKLQNEDTLHMFFTKEGAFKRVYITQKDLKIGPEIVAKELPDEKVPVLDEVRENEIIQDYARKSQSVPRNVFIFNDKALPVKEEIHLKGLLHTSFTYFDDLSVANMDSFKKVPRKSMVTKQGNCYTFYPIPSFEALHLSHRVHRLTRYPAVAERFQYGPNDGSCLYTAYDPQGNTKESGRLNGVGRRSGEWIFYDKNGHSAQETYINGKSEADAESDQKAKRQLDKRHEDERGKHEIWLRTMPLPIREGGTLADSSTVLLRQQQLKDNRIVCGQGTIYFSEFINFLAHQLVRNDQWVTFEKPLKYTSYAKNNFDMAYNFSVEVNTIKKDGTHRTVDAKIRDGLHGGQVRIVCDFGLFKNVDDSTRVALPDGACKISFDLINATNVSDPLNFRRGQIVKKPVRRASKRQYPPSKSRSKVD